MIRKLLLVFLTVIGAVGSGWGQTSVTTAEALRAAIAGAQSGTVITIVAGTYGSADKIETFGAVKVPNVTIKAATGATPQLYGTIQLMAAGCTVEGLTFYTQGGMHPVKNAIDVVAMSATIKNNVFNLLKPADGYVGNGVCIWPFGSETPASYTITGNTFKAFDALTPNWSSTAMSINEELVLDRFGEEWKDKKSKKVTLTNEIDLWTKNTFENCYADYIRSNWTFSAGDNTVGDAPVYHFVCMNNNKGEAIREALDYSASGAQVHVKGAYTFDKKLVISKGITLKGWDTPSGTQTTFSATTSFTDNLVSVEAVAQEVTLENLKITGSPKYGVHLYVSPNVKITGVTLSANKMGGMYVNGSTVVATNVRTENNSLGGIEVGKGNGVTTTPKLTLNSCQIKDVVAQIWADTDVSKEPKIAEWVVGEGWDRYEADLGRGKQTFWKQQVVSVLPVLTAPVASTIEAGQSLFASILTSGSAKVGNVMVAGLFAWKNPGEVVTKGTHSYPVVFTPNDLVKYKIAETTVEIKDIKQYYTVTSGKSANGKVTIKEVNAANKYAEGTTLTLTAEPDANYELDAWKDGVSSPYSVTKDAELTATFKQIMRKVTIGSNMTVKNGESSLSSGTTVAQGTVLTVIATPAEGKMLATLSCNGSIVSNGTVTVGNEDVAISATFVDKPADNHLVKIADDMQNGKILLFDAQGNAIPAGSAVANGTELSVLAVADQGYTAGEITGPTVTNGKCIINAETTFNVTFTKQKYAVTFTNPTGGQITVSENTSTGAELDYGTVRTAHVVSADGYKLLSLLVNGKEIPDGGRFTITAATEVKAVMRELATLNIDNAKQTYVYDGTEKAFVVKTTPAGIGGFKVTYGNEMPIDAAANDKKEYSVTIKRDADEVYKAVNTTAKLIIEAAEPTNVPTPEFSGSGAGAILKTDNGFAWKDAGSNSIRTVTYTPSDKNYVKVDMSIWDQAKTEPAKVAYSSPKLAQATFALRAGEVGNLNIEAIGGSVTVWNGTSQITDGGTLYVGQILTLKGIPASGKSAQATWTGAADVSGASTTIQLKAGDNSVKATFTSKSTPTAPTITVATAPYTGTVFGGKTPVASASGWNITFKQGETVVSEPTSAGTYTVFASRPEDALYVAVKDQSIGTFTITPVAATATVKSATAILQGQSLAQSIITGTANVDGTFEWEAPNTIMSTSGVINGQKLTFVPTSANYAPSPPLTTSVTVTAITGVTLRTLNVAVTNPDKGEVKMTLNGTDVFSGTIVTKGDKLKVTFKATAANYMASATIGGAADTSGAEYTVAETGNVDVKVSYTSTNGGGGTPDPGVVNVTGVSLAPATKALTVGAEFNLVATVAPSTATTKTVRWISSDPAVASVDANGKVKALKAGTSTITVTTDDGSFTASCDVTVSVSTGIEEILADCRVYARSGAICIEPARPVEVVIVNMTGVVLFRDQLTGSRQIPVSGGVYMVQLGDGKQVATVKVFVR